MKRKTKTIVGIAVVFVVAAVTISLFSAGKPQEDKQYLTESLKYSSVNAELRMESPSIGDCWRSENFFEVYESSYYQPGKKVSCSKPHDSVTFHVEALPSDMHMHYEPGTTFGHTAGTHDDIDLVRAKCRESLGQTFSASKTRLSWMWFLPDPFAWAAGARWLRCDVFINKVGSKVGTELGALNSFDLDVLQNLYSNNKFQLCVTLGPSGNPLGDDASYADCGGSWDQKLIAEKDIGDDYPDGYPGESTVTSIASQFCTENESDTYWYPNESGWGDGMYTIRCWSNR